MKISIITATWNSASTIESAVMSVSSQSYKNVEHIIIDGGSTDGTVDILNNLKMKNVNLIVVSEKDNGIYDALNKGISLSTGDVIGFMHSDDIYSGSEVIESIVNEFNEKNSDMVYGDLDYVEKNNIEKVVRAWRSGVFSRKKMKYGWMPPHPTVYMKNSKYIEMGGFDESYKISSDYDSMLRYMYAGNLKISYIDKVMVKMRVGGASNRSLKNLVIKTKEDIRAMKKHGIFWPVAIVYKNLSKIGQFI